MRPLIFLTIFLTISLIGNSQNYRSVTTDIIGHWEIHNVVSDSLKITTTYKRVYLSIKKQFRGITFLKNGKYSKRRVYSGRCGNERYGRKRVNRYFKVNFESEEIEFLNSENDVFATWKILSAKRNTLIVEQPKNTFHLL